MAKGNSERFVRGLSQRVVRLFYSKEASVVIDQLIKKEPAVKDEELAGRLGISTKDLAKAIQPLIDGGIVLSFIRNELREGAARVTPRVWYYQDLRYFRDALKWRMHILHEQFEAENKDEIAALGMVCPQCKTEYSLLDVGRCDNGRGGFDCEVCGVELAENNAATEIADSRDQVKRFLEQCKTINDALKEAGEMQLSSFEILRWLQVNFPVDKTGAPLGAAAPTTAGSSVPSSAVQVKIETEADVEARKRKEEEEELAKREANAQPAWFAKSTLEQERQPPPGPSQPPRAESIKLEGEDDDDDYETLFGSRSAASTPATSLEHSGILSVEPPQPQAGSKRARDDDSDNESTASQSKRVRMQLPSSPIIVEDTFEPVVIKAEEDDDDEVAFEAVEDEDAGERMFSCGGEMVSYDTIASDLNTYQAKMTPEEWSAFLLAA